MFTSAAWGAAGPCCGRAVTGDASGCYFFVVHPKHIDTGNPSTRPTEPTAKPLLFMSKIEILVALYHHSRHSGLLRPGRPRSQLPSICTQYSYEYDITNIIYEGNRIAAFAKRALPRFTLVLRSDVRREVRGGWSRPRHPAAHLGVRASSVLRQSVGRSTRILAAYARRWRPGEVPAHRLG